MHNVYKLRDEIKKWIGYNYYVYILSTLFAPLFAPILLYRDFHSHEDIDTLRYFSTVTFTLTKIPTLFDTPLLRLSLSQRYRHSSDRYSSTATFTLFDTLRRYSSTATFTLMTTHRFFHSHEEGQ